MYPLICKAVQILHALVIQVPFKDISMTTNRDEYESIFNSVDEQKASVTFQNQKKHLYLSVRSFALRTTAGDA
jgi:hypothetical protein